LRRRGKEKIILDADVTKKKFEKKGEQKVAGLKSIQGNPTRQYRKMA